MNFYEEKYKTPVSQVEKWRRQNKEREQIRNGCQDDLSQFIKVCNEFLGREITIDEWLELVDVMHDIERNSHDSFIGEPKVALKAVPLNPFSAWQKYKKLLVDKGFSELSIQQIENSTQKIVSQLSDNTSQDEPIRGIVVGNVQSGKTANMAGLIAMAADYGYNFFVVLTGTIDNLRLQTQERLVSDLSESGALTFVPLPFLSGSVDNPINKLQYLHLNEGENIRYLYVCLKNSSRLDDLLTWINSCEPKKRQLKMLILDDEADQAGINTANMSKDLVSKINSQIKALAFGRTKKEKYTEKGSPYKAVNYIGYTATPYANFLNEANDKSLYPTNFILSLNPAEEYIGPQQIFGIEDINSGLPIINNISPEEIGNIQKGKIDDIYTPTSLHSAIAWFICTVACFRYWKKKEPVTMLIHTSASVTKHFVVGKIVKDIILQFKFLFGLKFIEETYKTQINKLSEERFRKEVPNFPKNKKINKYPSFLEIKPYIKDLIEKQTTHIEMNKEEIKPEFNEGIHLCIDNCKANKITEENFILRLIYPDKQTQKDILDISPAFIVVGGSTLSRGLTLKGLTTTYFIRTTEQADTLMQMGRWFGYRKGYELLQRLWISDLVKRQFEFLTLLDYDLREELTNMGIMGMSPKEYGPRIDTFPNFRALKITSSNKSQNTIVLDKDYTNKKGQTTLFFNDEDIIEENYEKTIDFINGLGKVDRKKVDNLNNPYSKGKGLIWFDQPYEKVVKYVCSLKFPKENKKALLENEEEVLKWFKTQAENRYLTNFNVIVSTNLNEGTLVKLENVEIRLPTRTKIKDNTRENFINLKILTDPNDIFSDIDMSKLSNKEIDEIENSHQLKPVQKRIKYGLINTPCLIIYIIDKDSGKRSKNSDDREPLNLKQHLIGYNIYIPYGNDGKAKAKSVDCGKITVKLDFLRSSDSESDEDDY